MPSGIWQDNSVRAILQHSCALVGFFIGLLSIALCLAQVKHDEEPGVIQEKDADADLGKCLIAALRSGQEQDLTPIVATAEDYVADPLVGYITSDVRLSQDQIGRRAIEWSQKQRPAAAGSLRYVRRFGSEQGIDWRKAAIRKVPERPIIEIQWQDQVTSIVVPVMRGKDGRLCLSGKPWYPTLLSSNEIERFCRWNPGFNRDEDLAVGLILVRKAVTKAFLGYYWGNRGITRFEAYSVTLELPASFDTDQPDTLLLLQWLGIAPTERGSEVPLVETGKNTIEFRGVTNVGELLELPWTIKFGQSDVAKLAHCDSWSATVNDVVQVFSRVKGTQRTFHSPSVEFLILGSELPTGLVTLTLKDGVVTDVRLGSGAEDANVR